MIPGIYSAATAMDSAVRSHEAIAQNLAFANVPGYRQRGVAFTLPAQTAAEAKSGATKTATPFVDFRPGALQFTGAPLDFAIDGDAFFAVQGPNGTAYTRNGSFHLSSSGQIVSQAGYPLMGAGGPLTVPSDASGDIRVASDGTVSAGNQQIGQIQLTKFSDTTKLDPVGPTMFRARSGAGPSTSKSRVLQGYREASNVQPAEAMVAMINGARNFEAANRAMKAIADSLQLNTRPQGA